MKYVLTLDVGTTAVKAGLFSEHLESISFAVREYRLLTPGPDQVEMDPEVYWTEAKEAILAAVSRAGVTPQDIISITCTTQGETLIPVGKDKKHLANAIVWLDSRAKSEADFIAKGFEKITIYQVAGLPEINGYCPIAKVLWVKNNMPEMYAKTEKFLLLEDYLILRLCGIYVTNPPLMCSTGYFNIHSDMLWEEMLRYCGISADKFPEVVPSGTIIGKLLGSVAGDLGLSPEVMVTTGAMDQVASAVGSGNTAVGIVSETTGTAQVVAATCEKNVPEQWTPVTIYRHAVGDAFLKIVINQTAGIAYKWFRDEFCIDLAKAHEDAFDAMGALAEKEPAGSRGLIFFPHLTGMQFPQSDETLRGAFVGVGLDTNRGCFIRAIMEGVGFMLRESIEGMNLKPESIISLGGGAKSPLWCQIKADISGIKIAILEHAESTSLGAAVMGCVAMGIYSDYQTAAKALVRESEFQPVAENHDLYQPAYAEYQAMYCLFSPIFKNRKKGANR
jgi:xylulokinase